MAAPHGSIISAPARQAPAAVPLRTLLAEAREGLPKAHVVDLFRGARGESGDHLPGLEVVGIRRDRALGDLGDALLECFVNALERAAACATRTESPPGPTLTWPGQPFTTASG